MAETNEVDDCDLDALLNLLDDDDTQITNPPQQQLPTISNLQASNSSSTYNKSHLENSKNPQDESVRKDSSKQQTNNFDASKEKNKNVLSDSHVDPLEKELLLMEEKMRKLREEISKKKNFRPSDSGSKGFTKLSCVINPECKATESVRFLNEKEKSNLFNDLNSKKSEIHSGETDSEDEEDNRMPLEAQMTSYGRDMKKRLAHSAIEARERPAIKDNGVWKGDQSRALMPLAKPKLPPAEKVLDSVVDPFSGLRVVKPLISQDVMKEMMYSRRMINMSSIISQLRGGEIEGDWVTIGVIVSKSETKTSQKGSQYLIWQMSDLRDCTKIASVFLFAGAYKQLWKTVVGSVVGILNPQIMKDSNKKTDGRCVITLSVNNHEKILLMGTSKDLGCCKGRTAQGPCRQFVNKNVCEFCIFHIQNEHRKMNVKTRRPELHSSFARVDPRQALQKKVLGRDQVFYGGQLYSSNETAPKRKLLPSTKGKELSALSSLSMKLKAETLKEKDKKDSFVLQNLTEEQLSTVVKVTKENEELGQMLLAPSFGARNFLLHKTKSLETKSDATPTSLLNKQAKFSAKEFLKSTRTNGKSEKLVPKTPQLGRGLSPGKSFEIEFPSNSRFNSAKEKALSIVKKQGGLKAVEKNMVKNKEKSSKDEFKSNVKKRIRDEDEVEAESSSHSKALKTGDISELKMKLNPKSSLLGSVDINSEEFLKMLNAKSSHTNLIQTAEDEEVDKYYNSLEKKEMLENKMATTMELPTSAVVCLKCKYKATSAAEHCKAEKHPMKVIKATKRFFECRNCKQRTMSLEKLPMKPCSHCSQSSWKRAAMWKEKQGPKLDTEVLSLRGDELNHISGNSNKIYLNL